jgi:hypothetical protein
MKDPVMMGLSKILLGGAVAATTLYACVIRGPADDAADGGTAADGGAPNTQDATSTTDASTDRFDADTSQDASAPLNCTMPSATGPANAVASTVTGGLWNDTKTWVGGKVPAAKDDVVIHGEVHVDLGDGDAPVSCASVTVAAGGFLRSASNAARKIAVQGDFVNFGAVRNGPSYASYDTATLEVHVGGRFFQQGEYGVLSTHFTGTRDQEIAVREGKSLAGSFTDDNASSALRACSPISVAGLQLALGKSGGARATLDMGTYALTLAAGEVEITNGVLRASKIVGVAGATLNSDKITAVGTLVVDGDVRTADSVIEGSVEVLPTGVLYNLANATPTLIIRGSLQNRGIVRRGPGYAAYGEGDLTVEITGDINQNGQYTPTKTKLVGTTKQTLTLGPGKVLTGTFTDSNAAAPFAAGNDWTVGAATFDLGATGTLDMGAYSLTHAVGDLKVTGGTLLVDRITGGDDGNGTFSVPAIKPPSGTLTVHKHFRTSTSTVTGNLVVAADAHVYNAYNVEARLTVTGTVSQQGTMGSGPGYASYDSGSLFLNGLKLANW